MSETKAGALERVVPIPSPALVERIRRHRRHTLELLTVCVVALVPWTVLLGLTLPSGYKVHHWRVTWVGFDVLLLVAMVSTALFGWRRHRGVIVAALATAVLLIGDAWFDVSLAFGTSEVWPAAALAVFGELPLAGYLMYRVMRMLSFVQWPYPGKAVAGEQANGPGAC